MNRQIDKMYEGCTPIGSIYNHNLFFSLLSPSTEGQHKRENYSK